MNTRRKTLEDTVASRITNEVRKECKVYENWPKPGVMFRDTMPLYRRPALIDAMLMCIEKKLREGFAPKNFQRIAGIDATGFLIGTAMALYFEVPFVAIRKAEQLPGVIQCINCGRGELCVQADKVPEDCKFLVVDAVLATGTRMAAAKRLINLAGGEVVCLVSLFEVPHLHGRERLSSTPYFSLVND